MSGVRVRFLRREEVLPHLADLARELVALRLDVLEVSLFGSLARGNHGASSDADIYILLRSDPRRFIDRISEFLDHFSDVGVPVEVFPYTLQEMETMKGSAFITTLEREKILLASRTS
jgi:predicted nucleotidyltransferase